MHLILPDYNEMREFTLLPFLQHQLAENFPQRVKTKSLQNTDFCCNRDSTLIHTHRCPQDKFLAQMT